MTGTLYLSIDIGTSAVKEAVVAGLPVVATEIAVRLQVVADANAGATPDPDDLEARSDELLVREIAASVASGRVLTMKL